MQIFIHSASIPRLPVLTNVRVTLDAGGIPSDQVGLILLEMRHNVIVQKLQFFFRRNIKNQTLIDVMSVHRVALMFL